MMLIEITAFNSRVEGLQHNVTREIEKIASEFAIPIQLSGLWCNTIVMRSEMSPAIATYFLAKLMNFLTTDTYGKEYVVSEVVIKKSVADKGI